MHDDAGVGGVDGPRRAGVDGVHLGRAQQFRRVQQFRRPKQFRRSQQVRCP
jgi:hypothetical protein